MGRNPLPSPIKKKPLYERFNLFSARERMLAIDEIMDDIERERNPQAPRISPRPPPPRGSQESLEHYMNRVIPPPDIQLIRE